MHVLQKFILKEIKSSVSQSFWAEVSGQHVESKGTCCQIIGSDDSTIICDSTRKKWITTCEVFLRITVCIGEARTTPLSFSLDSLKWVFVTINK